MVTTMVDFPAELQAELDSIKQNDGVLLADKCKIICEFLSLDLASLMVKLLPLAASHSVAPISDFNVGAIAQGAKSENGYSSLYFGANFEYANLALCYSVHAEQSAISNAWLHNATAILSIATSAAPCGHCRQFLYEVAGDNPFAIIMPSDEKTLLENSPKEKNYQQIELTQLLPAAFGPVDLGCDRLLIDDSFSSNNLCQENEKKSFDDTLFNQAFQAANLCYAPYTKNYVGCAIELNSGKIVSGRYVENAAHNPSLSAFSSAISSLSMVQDDFDASAIKRVVVIEHATNSSQKETIKLLLTSLNSTVKLEYFSVAIA